MKSNNGFTLIELLITLMISTVLMLGLTMVFRSEQKSTYVQTNVSDMQQSLRAAMDFMVRDIRMAGYDPLNSGNFGVVDVAFRDYSATQDADGDGFLQISWDADEDGNLDDNEVVSYSLFDKSDAAPGSIALMRRLNSEVARQPLAGYVINMGFAFAIDADHDGRLDRDAAGGVLWLVDSGSDGEWDALDASGDGVISAADLPAGGGVGRIVGTPTGISVSTKDIRAVRIWLLSRAEGRDPDFVDSNVYVVGRDVIQPNDGFRHRLLDRTVLCRNMGLD
jgi:type IV pilus assembly protein PilW